MGMTIAPASAAITFNVAQICRIDRSPSEEILVAHSSCVSNCMDCHLVAVQIRRNSECR